MIDYFLKKFEKVLIKYFNLFLINYLKKLSELIRDFKNNNMEIESDDL